MSSSSSSGMAKAGSTSIPKWDSQLKPTDGSKYMNLTRSVFIGQVQSKYPRLAELMMYLSVLASVASNPEGRGKTKAKTQDEATIDRLRNALKEEEELLVDLEGKKGGK